MNRLLYASALAGLAATSFDGFSAPASALRLDDCQLDSQFGSGSVSGRCGWYEVAEDRQNPASKLIRIHVAVVPALRRQALPDPVFVLSGGPGQAASDFYLANSRAFEQLRRERDLVIVDQRGTGKSNRLDCDFPDELDNPRFDTDSVKAAARDCLAKLPGDPRFYSTTVAVTDLEEIRAALGYNQINLYGISYGTRVAQHYIRRYPQRVRSVVLDGVVPVEIALGPEVAPAAQQTLEAILSRCLELDDCHKKYPDIKTDLAHLRSRLAQKPITITVVDPTTAQPKPLEFSTMHLAAALRLHSYSDDTASLLPYLIHEAAQGRPEALAAQALLVARDLNEQLANGMHNAVVCTEDVPFFTPEALHDSAIEKSYLTRLFVDTLLALCSVWPRGTIDSDFHATLASQSPALLLSGENDPVTPAAYGARALQDFRKGKHLIVPGQGHGQLNNPCVARIMTRFIELAANESLDIKCVAMQAAAPFMLNAMSPGP